MREHVGLVGAREPLDRGAVEPEPLGERPLDLRRRDGDRLERADDIGEPEPDELDPALFNRSENEVALLVHGAPCDDHFPALRPLHPRY